jgi:hypothetical protein
MTSNHRPLPDRMLLLAYDLHKDRLTEKAWLDYLVRAAALAQLLAGGQLVDAGRAVHPAAGQRPPDQVLDLVLAEVEGATARDWRALLHHSKATVQAVEDRLVRAGTVRPKGRGIVALDRETVAAIQAKARRLLHDADPAPVDLGDAVLVTLASVVPLRTVFDRRRKHQDQGRVAVLAGRVCQGGPGFERLLAQVRHTRGRSYSAGGPVH